MEITLYATAGEVEHDLADALQTAGWPFSFGSGFTELLQGHPLDSQRSDFIQKWLSMNKINRAVHIIRLGQKLYICRGIGSFQLQMSPELPLSQVDAKTVIFGDQLLFQTGQCWIGAVISQPNPVTDILVCLSCKELKSALFMAGRITNI
ncbi:MAG TPA: hypothetical protein P5031_07185 [Candidatus Syntrophosphaera sp.]|nr:hypothetical protein [Candidatus Syntrophosphaera sp.]